MRYADRADAGRALARVLEPYRAGPPARVLGLARGGVAVAAPIARALARPLDVLVVRKLGLPWAPEVAFGAIGPYGVDVRSPEAADRLTPAEAEEVASRARAEVDRRIQRYRGDRPPLSLVGEIALLVDDGLATGATAHAAVMLARELKAEQVVVAVPVGSPQAVATLRTTADAVVCPESPQWFDAVSRYYRSFDQVTDDEVMELLATAWSESPPDPGA
jgi:predicted phosphoribosyltransferase